MKNEVNNIKNGLGGIPPTTAIKRMIREHYKRYDSHRFDSLEKTEQVQLIQIEELATHTYIINFFLPIC